ncbi:HD domain-containing protein [Candidatus Woesearchaeota archaeon]|nr:HD domain-containing protein [Candidatus Woesearchaeota archaeon]
MIPSRRQCFELLWHHGVPSEVIRHSVSVCRFALGIAAKRKDVNIKLLEASCLLHDIGKMDSIVKGGKHELIGSRILIKHGYGEVARVIRKHSLHYILDKKKAPREIEEKILFYADKRVMGHRVVSLKRRLDDLRERYPQYRESMDKAEPLVIRLEKMFLE